MKTNAKCFAVLIVFAVAIVAGCKTVKPAQPTDQTLRDAAVKYFTDAGYTKITEGKFQIKDEATGQPRIETLDLTIIHVIKYDNAQYPWQGIIPSKTTTTAQGKGKVVASPFIMYWSARDRAWRHLVGRDIPQPRSTQ